MVVFFKEYKCAHHTSASYSAAHSYHERDDAVGKYDGKFLATY